VEKAQRITDTYARTILYEKAEKLICEEEAAVMPLFYRSNAMLVKPWLNVKIWPMLGNHIQSWSFRD